ncbi:MAG: MBL fold metallo-hydrolase [Desulfobacteraceae bacterium]|nr:MAG: MBL fold metallo-hydrolase [Desulfobacteraceae bacterium]
MQEIVKKIHWLGHDAFRIDGEKVIYIDPYQIKGGPKADIILVTHEHFDHCSPDDIQKIQQAATVIVTEKDSAKKLKGDVRILKSGASILIDKVKIEAVPSYNIDKQFHPQKNGWLGFVLEMNGVRIYHAGDTDFIPEMKNLKVDIALLPVSGTYVMTADQAIKAALAIKPKLAIPMHYGAIVGTDEDAIKFKELLAGKVEVQILNKE